MFKAMSSKSFDIHLLKITFLFEGVPGRSDFILQYGAQN